MEDCLVYVYRSIVLNNSQSYHDLFNLFCWKEIRFQKYLGNNQPIHLKTNLTTNLLFEIVYEQCPNTVFTFGCESGYRSLNNHQGH